MQTYRSNFQKRQTMRSEANLQTSTGMTDMTITLPSMPLIRSRREKIIHPH